MKKTDRSFYNVKVLDVRGVFLLFKKGKGRIVLVEDRIEEGCESDCWKKPARMLAFSER